MAPGCNRGPSTSSGPGEGVRPRSSMRTALRRAQERLSSKITIGTCFFLYLIHYRAEKCADHAADFSVRVVLGW